MSDYLYPGKGLNHPTYITQVCIWYLFHAGDRKPGIPHATYLAMCAFGNARLAVTEDYDPIVAVAFPPYYPRSEYDEHDRRTCPKAGCIGHWGCGVCEHGRLYADCRTCMLRRVYECEGDPRV